jgi:non-heme chloroperoxidase
VDTVSRDGTLISYLERGRAGAPPLVLLHGWAQSADCWGEEVLDGLSAGHHVLAPDLRGHGRSGAPAGGYDDPTAWAADLDAVLAAAGVREPPVLVGWSYGGLVACDWLRSGGGGAGGVAAGLVLVGAVTGLGRGRAGGRVGAAMRAAVPDGLSEDPALAVPALAGFAGALTTDGPRAQALLGASLATPPRVRAALFARTCDSDDVLAGFGGPSVVLHGTADAVVDVSAGRHAADLLPAVRTSWWEGSGHAPFVEDPQRFVAEVLAVRAS